ncbi:OmpA family protein [Rhodoferax aquaticus]|uniref:OmpA family protein n=1 Tax=Rhodoferax aquaticus TaxID=2527691 RepID=A0A515EUC9_9BURK|nr:OmpA family protein [Rhodoferax aquaticus]QDL56285.1 OmpA family protein [Rhodoferax aquaticus]
MKSHHLPLVYSLVLAALLPSLVCAQAVPIEGYLVDSSGRFVGSATPGQCWHTAEWTPALAQAPCDPVAKVAAAVTPKPAFEPNALPASGAAPVAAVAAAPPPMKTAFSADALFAFDQSSLKPEGTQMLDDLVAQLQVSNYDQVMVTGDADRIGSAVYNQKLSERRAQTVQAYLLKKDVAATKISTSGQGESNPVTTHQDCADKKGAPLIACLQPDRRVDVEMQGTKAATATP